MIPLAGPTDGENPSRILHVVTGPSVSIAWAVIEESNTMHNLLRRGLNCRWLEIEDQIHHRDVLVECQRVVQSPEPVATSNSERSPAAYRHLHPNSGEDANPQAIPQTKPGGVHTATQPAHLRITRHQFRELTGMDCRIGKNDGPGAENRHIDTVGIIRTCRVGAGG